MARHMASKKSMKDLLERSIATRPESATFGAALAPDHETTGLLTDIQQAPSDRSEFEVTIPALIATLRNDAELAVVRLASGAGRRR